MVTEPKPYRFTTEQYDQMVKNGILPEDARLELIDGEILEMTPVGDRHVEVVRRLRQTFTRLEIEGQTVMDVQSPIRLVDRSEPQPDLVLLQPQAGEYAGLGKAEDVLLVIEVTDTNLDHDRRKALIYAAAAVPEYWLINVGLDPATITVYRQPEPDGYHSIQVVRRGERLAPEVFPDFTLDTDKLLG